MLVTIKPHSTLKHYFIGDDISIHIDSYSDVLDYLSVMQPNFMRYSKELVADGVQESFVFLDDQLIEIQPEEFLIKRFKADTTIHIVPVVMGGGGKRGSILAILAAAALFYVAGPLGNALVGTEIAGTTLTAAGVKSAVTSIATSLAISGLAAMFQKTPSAAKDSESARIENNMFSSLTNTISSGTNVPINYGMVRVAGHLVTGYIKTINHPKGFKVRVTDVIGLDSSLYNSDQAGQSNFITVPVSTNLVAREDLVFYIDPGVSASYSGTGTTVTDLVSGQQGTIVGNVFLENFTFKLGGGYIDMNKSYVSASEINDTNKTYTIEFWTKIAQGTSGAIISNSALGVNLTSTFDTVRVLEGGGRAEAYVDRAVYYGDVSPINTSPSNATRLILNSWIHVVYTLSGTALRTYINGALIRTDTVSTSITGAGDLVVGNTSLSGNYIGLARLYKKALSIDEINKNFNTEKARFEISSGSTVLAPPRPTQQVYDHASDR